MFLLGVMGGACTSTCVQPKKHTKHLGHVYTLGKLSRNNNSSGMGMGYLGIPGEVLDILGICDNKGSLCCTEHKNTHTTMSFRQTSERSRKHNFRVWPMSVLPRKLGNNNCKQWEKLSRYSQHGGQLLPVCCNAVPVKIN